MPYATWVAPNISTTICCLIHSPTLIDYCTMFYEVFVTLLPNYFSLKSVGLFHPKGSRCATVFQPVDKNILS